MKKHSGILTVIASLMLSILLAACGSKAASSYIGTWKAVSYNDFGTLMGTDALGESALELKSGGKGTFSMMGGETSNITWKEADKGITVSYGGTDLTGTMNGNVLMLGDEDLQLYMTINGAEAKWSAEPDLQTADQIIGGSTASSAGSAADTVSAADWYGRYSGLLRIEDTFGTRNASYQGEEDAVYGYFEQDSVDFIELYMNEDYANSDASPFFSTYVTVSGSSFTVAGNENWFGDYDFTAADNAISSVQVTSTSPLTFVMTGTYYDPSGDTAVSDGFHWTIALSKISDETAENTGTPAASAVSPAAAASSGNAGLTGAFSTATKTITGSGVTITYPKDLDASINTVENPQVDFPNDIWVTASKASPALISYADCLDYEKGYSGKKGYQLYESTYNGSKCIVMMHDGAGNGDYEAEMEIVIYLDDGSAITIHVSTLDAPLSEMTGNADLMATAAGITWQ